MRRGLLLLGLTAVAAGVLLSALGALSGAQEVRASAAALPAHIYGLFLGAFVINTLCRGGRWWVGARKLALPVSGGRMYLFYVAGFALAATPGKVGTVIRVWLLKQKQGIAYTRSTPLFMLDQLTDFAAYLLLFGFGASAVLGVIGLKNPLWQYLLLGSLLIGTLALLFYPPLLRGVIKGSYALLGWRRPRLFARLLRIQRYIHLSLGGRTVLVMLCLSLVGWLAPIYTLFYTLNVMGIDVSLALVSGLFTLVVIAGVLSFLPGGVGVTEAGLAAALVLVGAPLSLAVVLTALMRFFTLWLAVLIGLVALPMALKLKAEHVQ